jgi:hypothetical protein
MSSKTEIITAEIITATPAAAAEIAAINHFHRAATARADEARAKAQEASHYALLCGTRLEALKSTCQHGQWGQLFTKRPKNLTANSAHIGECAEFEFSEDTAARYIEVARRIRLEQQLSGKSQKRLATIAAAPEIDADSRDFLTKITEGRNLRQLYLDLDIITAKPKEKPEKDDPPAPPRIPKSTAQCKLEEAREFFHYWRADFEKMVRIGCLDDLDKEGLLQLKEFAATVRERVTARLK